MVLRRTCSLWKLDVLAIALTPSSFASKPSACQSRQRVRSDPKRQKPPFAHRMYFFFAEACRLGSVKLFFTEPCSRRDRFVFLSSFALPFPFRTVRTPRQLVPFPSIHTTPLAFRILQLSDVGRTVIVLNRVLQFFAHFPQQSEKFLDLGTRTWRGADPQCSGVCMLFRGTSKWVRVGHTFGSIRARQPKCGCSETALLFAKTFI